ncbi:hypothetical protein QUT57_22730, partial [Xanthomonas citri pv. citri]
AASEDVPPHNFPNRTTFVIAWFCVFARSSAAIDCARDKTRQKMTLIISISPNFPQRSPHKFVNVMA